MLTIDHLFIDSTIDYYFSNYLYFYGEAKKSKQIFHVKIMSIYSITNPTVSYCFNTSYLLIYSVILS